MIEGELFVLVLRLLVYMQVFKYSYFLHKIKIFYKNLLYKHCYQGGSERE